MEYQRHGTNERARYGDHRQSKQCSKLPQAALSIAFIHQLMPDETSVAEATSRCQQQILPKQMEEKSVLQKRNFSSFHFSK